MTMTTMTYRRYTVDFLLTRRGNASFIKEIEDINLYIKEHSANRESPVIRRELPGRFMTRPQHFQRQQPQQQQRGYRPRREVAPAIQATKMPIKTGRSDLTLLLNKLGEDNVDAIADNVAKVFNDTEDVKELTSWFLDKTLPQTQLAGIFAAMWLRIFKDNPAVKAEYMKLCRGRFEARTYDASDSDNLIILQLAHAIPALYEKAAVSVNPLRALIKGYLDNLINSPGCFDALLLMIPTIGAESGKIMCSHIREMSTTKRHSLATCVIAALTTQGTYLELAIHLSEALIAADPEQTPPATFHFTHTLSQWQAALLVALLKRQKIPRSYLQEVAERLVHDIQEKPDTIETLLVLMTGGGSWLPDSLKAEAVKKAEEVSANASAYGVSMKVRFKFMDLLDLAKREWKPKIR